MPLTRDPNSREGARKNAVGTGIASRLQRTDNYKACQKKGLLGESRFLKLRAHFGR
jgi:hypothetical protein